MIWILGLSFLSSSLEREKRSFPLKYTSPSVLSCKRRIVRPIVDLPHPDSPTRPIVVPRLIANDTPSTAFTLPTVILKKLLLIGKYFFRFLTTRRLSGLFSAPSSKSTFLISSAIYSSSGLTVFGYSMTFFSS